MDDDWKIGKWKRMSRISISVTKCFIRICSSCQTKLTCSNTEGNGNRFTAKLVKRIKRNPNEEKCEILIVKEDRIESDNNTATSRTNFELGSKSLRKGEQTQNPSKTEQWKLTLKIQKKNSKGNQDIDIEPRNEHSVK